jgi:hypothetical protein
VSACERVCDATPKRQISRQGAIRLLSDLLADQDGEIARLHAQITRLHTLCVKHWCTCPGKRAQEPLNLTRHSPACGYRQAME